MYWLGGLTGILFFSFVLYKYVVAPYTTRWHAYYGEIEYPAGYSIHGLDISHYQQTIDWDAVSRTKVAGEPLRFVIIKATEGDKRLDPNFNDNFYQALQYGLVRGAYHYFRPDISAQKQAEYYLRQVHLEPGDLPPVLDIEEKGTLSTAALRAAALTWLQQAEAKYGVAPIIYTGYKFKVDYLSTPEFEHYPFWIAHYYVKECGYTGAWKFWQHTDCGRVDGIEGKVDLNVYNGSMYDLRKLTIPEEEFE